MAAVRSRGNRTTEVRLASLFRAHGITGWRRHQRLPGKPDFVFARERVAVFVDGCFWHGCPWHCRIPQDNRLYWERKVLRNKTRDRAVKHELGHLGWRVVRVWEHALRFPNRVIRRVRRELLASVPGCAIR